MTFDPNLFLDKPWRVNNLYTIIDKSGQQIPFRQNQLQRQVSEDESKRKMILKARQFGFSTNEIVEMFDDVMFTNNMTAVIIAHEQDSIKKLFRIVQRLYKFLPEDIKPRIDRGGGSKYEMFFPEKNSRIYCDLESRSDTIQRLHVSEAAFMKDSAKLKATLQTVPIINGRVTIETTANGMANHFYDMWSDTSQPYKKLFFPWFLFKEYQLPVTDKIKPTEEEILFIKKAKSQFNVSITKEQIMFRRFKKAELKASSHDKTRVSFEQEYPEDDASCFLSSGEAVMDLFKIKKQMDELVGPIKDKDGLKVYKEKQPGRRYACGADVAEGVRKDWSVGVMLDIESKEVVAKLRGQWKPSDFAKKLNEMCKLYSRSGSQCPILAVERNNHGHAVLLELNEHLSYPNLFVNPQDERLGWYTNSITRPIMINAFIDCIEDRLLKVNDKELLTECLTLIDNNGKIEAADGKHDDCVVATSIALQIALTNSVSIYDGIENKILL